RYNNEPELTDECIKDNYDSQQIHINSMLNNISDDKIQEAWHPVSHGIVCWHYFAVLLESNVAIFYISFIMQQWYKDAYFNEPEDTFNNILLIRPHNNNPNRPASGSKKPNKKFLQDRIHYSKSYGLLQTILILAIETKTDEEVNDWCHQFIQQKKELLKADTASIMPVKGRPSRRQKSVLEQEAKKPL
ncbi:3098_t:CDS:2, partial [Cetraspora pellucida]